MHSSPAVQRSSPSGVGQLRIPGSRKTLLAAPNFATDGGWARTRLLPSCGRFAPSWWSSDQTAISWYPMPGPALQTCTSSVATRIM